MQVRECFFDLSFRELSWQCSVFNSSYFYFLLSQPAPSIDCVPLKFILDSLALFLWEDSDINEDHFISKLPSVT